MCHWEFCSLLSDGSKHLCLKRKKKTKPNTSSETWGMSKMCWGEVDLTVGLQPSLLLCYPSLLFLVMVEFEASASILWYRMPSDCLAALAQGAHDAQLTVKWWLCDAWCKWGKVFRCSSVWPVFIFRFPKMQMLQCSDSGALSFPPRIEAWIGGWLGLEGTSWIGFPGWRPELPVDSGWALTAALISKMSCCSRSMWRHSDFNVVMLRRKWRGKMKCWGSNSCLVFQKGEQRNHFVNSTFKRCISVPIINISCVLLSTLQALLSSPKSYYGSLLLSVLKIRHSLKYRSLFILLNASEPNVCTDNSWVHSRS